MSKAAENQPKQQEKNIAATFTVVAGFGSEILHEQQNAMQRLRLVRAN